MERLQDAGFDTGPSEPPIIPAVVGEDMAAFKMCRRLADEVGGGGEPAGGQVAGRQPERGFGSRVAFAAGGQGLEFLVQAGAAAMEAANFLHELKKEEVREPKAEVSIQAVAAE